MAAPGDPQTPDDHDDLIGFTSPSSLTGAERAARPSPKPRPEPVPSAIDEDDAVERDLFEDRPSAPRPTPAPDAVSDTPQWARETVRASRPAATARSAPPLEGAMGLYTVYALILFAVPTLGVSALIGLLAVITRAVPDQPLARSHFQFQKRTLMIAAVGAVLGVILIAVNLGVFVLFALALWVLIRGAAGAMRLASGRPIANPQTLFI
ncbi:MAG: rane protein-like protein [Brevundimonas sp.]|nr:rane protein-like protein [Brevundimonas sp.]